MTPRPRSKCQREGCGDQYRDHTERVDLYPNMPAVTTMWCPDGKGSFVPRERRVERRLTCSEQETLALAAVLEAVMAKDTRRALAAADVRAETLGRVLSRLRVAKARAARANGNAVAAGAVVVAEAGE